MAKCVHHALLSISLDAKLEFTYKDDEMFSRGYHTNELILVITIYVFVLSCVIIVDNCVKIGCL